MVEQQARYLALDAFRGMTIFMVIVNFAFFFMLLNWTMSYLLDKKRIYIKV